MDEQAKKWIADKKEINKHRDYEVARAAMVAAEHAARIQAEHAARMAVE